MLQLLEAIKRIIERFIVNRTPISSPISKGDTTIALKSSRRYRAGDSIAVFDENIGEGEMKTIACIPDANTIEICEPMIEDYLTLETTFAEKLIEGNFIKAIYIGDPAKISHYPAISINAREKSNEWFTLTSTSETFNIDISVFTLAGDYESSYRSMHAYAEKIEEALFRSLFPLAGPFHIAILANDVSASDTIIQVTNAQDILGVSGYIWLESWDYLRNNRVREVLDIDAGVYQLAFPVGRDFSAGDNVIRPGRHFYNAFPRGIQYGTINQESTVFKAAVVSYMAQEEVKRGVPFIDPLTF